MAGHEAPWSLEKVAARFEDAAHTARQLPPVRVQGYFNVWPQIARERWERLCADDPPVARYPPSPRDVDRMLEVMRWVQCLPLEQRQLVWMRADRHEWQRIARRFGCCVKTAQRRWQQALQVVVDALNDGLLRSAPQREMGGFGQF